MKITLYPSVQNVTNSDVFLVDGTEGTKIITAGELTSSLLELLPPENHRTIFRGKNLGDMFTTDQKAAIQNGTFKDLWLGDYWEIGGKKYRIADINYFYGCQQPSEKTNHLVIVPDLTMYKHAMDNSDTTSGGYLGSTMHEIGLSSAITTISGVFGETNVLTNKEYVSTSVSNGIVSSCEVALLKACLMSERMVYGHSIFSSPLNKDGVSDNFGVLCPYDKTQFALFTAQPMFITSDNYYWLRDVVSSEYFARVDRYGKTLWGRSSLSYGVRPYFCIG